MAIAAMTDFVESTALERLVLDRLCPVSSDDESKVLNLRQAMAGTKSMVISMSFTESLSAQTVESTTFNTMPLLFGAAQEMLDLLIELALCQADIKPDQKTSYVISEKVKAAKNGDGACALSSTDQSLWVFVCAAYAVTSQCAFA